MAISTATRNRLLVEARHRCSICAEKCFEIHHIDEQADGGSDDYDNLIVLCPNCHQHRYHRAKEFNKTQIRQYKAKLQEDNEIERRLLLNLEELRAGLATATPDEIELKLKAELQSVAKLISPDRSERTREAVEDTSRWLAERERMRGGARRAIELNLTCNGSARKPSSRRSVLTALTIRPGAKLPISQRPTSLSLC